MLHLMKRGQKGSSPLLALDTLSRGVRSSIEASERQSRAGDLPIPCSTARADPLSFLRQLRRGVPSPALIAHSKASSVSLNSCATTLLRSHGSDSSAALPRPASPTPLQYP